MKKFQFTLQRLLEYREQLLETEKNTLAAMRGELARLNAELEKILAELSALEEKLAGILSAGTNATELSTIKRYMTSKQQEIHLMRHKIMLKERETEAQLQKVVAATQEVKTLEKLRENQLEDYRKQEQHEEELFIEEFISSVSHRNNAEDETNDKGRD